MSVARDDITIGLQMDASDRGHAAMLYWDAFKGKLGALLGPKERALRFLEAVIDQRFVLSAYDGDRQLVGIAGFKTADGQFVGGTLRDLAKIYGWSGALWRAMLLALLERPVAAGELLMDGICVDASMRGRGVGTRLLNAVKDKACAFKLDRLRLDVIDTNPAARRLYEREGFVAGEVSHAGPLRWLFGFQTSTAMRFDLAMHTVPGGPR